jgi:hypothetical protein
VALVTETTDLAADLLVLELRELEARFIRLNLDRMPSDSAIVWHSPSSNGDRIIEAGRSRALSPVGAAWFRRFPTREANPTSTEGFIADQIHLAWRGFFQGAHWAWMNNPSAVSAAELKMSQLRAASAVGLMIPETLVTNDPTSAREFVADGPTIAKTIASRTMQEHDSTYAVFAQTVTVPDFDEDDAIGGCPMILQRRIDHEADVRVTVVGDQVFGASIHVSQRQPTDVDWRAVNQSRIRYDPFIPSPVVAEACLMLLKAFDLSYGALDFLRTPKGDLIFLELNPSGQWGWIERAVSLPISRAIAQTLVAMARERLT